MTTATDEKPKRNRHLTQQELVANRLDRLNWKHDTPGAGSGYFRKGNLRIIVGESETLLSAFDPDFGRKIEWEITFGPLTPWKVVMAAVHQASEGSGT